MPPLYHSAYSTLRNNKPPQIDINEISERTNFFFRSICRCLVSLAKAFCYFYFSRPFFGQVDRICRRGVAFCGTNDRLTFLLMLLRVFAI